jgi:ribosomal protein L11 methyltransferase
MNQHIQITFNNIQTEQSELLIAQLAEYGYEGFHEEENSLKAFIQDDKFNRQYVEELSTRYHLAFEQETIAAQNWNEVWESNFEPVVVDDFVAIRAEFHEPITNVQHEIIITPKMSFGTGHHATTAMMIRQMRSIDMTGKTVFDFGTGTGILAILAERMGAKTVVAIDNDEWSIRNAEENILRNNCDRIQLRQNDTAFVEGHFDIILANINKNVIVENLSSLISQLNNKGTLLLSGLLSEDEVDILLHVSRYPLILNGKTADKGWISLRFAY